MRNFFYISALCVMAICHAAEEIPDRPIRIGARYTTPRGIGYKKGYTTLEGFVSGMIRDEWLPFLDLRGHVFDDGKLAANGGLGLRYLSASRVWGMNGYYDYRNTTRQHYNQVAIGFESLGPVWDFRLNGYLPVGKKASSKRHTHFGYFKDHYMYLKSTKDIAFKGVNLEAGAHINRYYLAAGPYYLNYKGENGWGGQLRGSINLLKNYLRLDGNISYDTFFKWNGQGQIGINIPLGKELKASCPKTDPTLYARAVQRVDRNEIIPVGQHHPTSLAINPATGEPYFFVFVDNTSSSLGTFESPYPSLLEAETNSLPGQIIYVFPGNGTSTNMSSGITLQEGQMFLGSSTYQPITTTLGTILIPPSTATLPIITNSLAAPVVTLSNNNLVSGFYIQNLNGSGIEGTSIENFTATQNTIIGGASPGLTVPGILLTNITGQLEISDNLFYQTNNAPSTNSAVHIVLTQGTCSVNFNRDNFYGIPSVTPVNGILVELSQTSSIDTLTVQNSYFHNSTASGSGIEIDLSNNGTINDFIFSNSKTSFLNNGIYTNLSNSGVIRNIDVSNSTFTKGSSGINLSAVDTSLIENVRISNTSMDGNNNPSIYGNLSTSVNIVNFELLDSVIEGNGSYAIYFGLGTGSIENLSVINSRIIKGSSAGLEVYMGSTGTVNQFLFQDSVLQNGAYGLYIYANNNNVIDRFQVLRSSFERVTSQGVFLTTNMTTLTVNELEISNSTFSNCRTGLLLDTGTKILSGTVDQNVFDLSVVTGINVTTSTSDNVLSVTGNTFTNTLTSAVGYGATFTTSSGSLCLNFTGNDSYPITQGGGIDPYYFNNTGGTFNITQETTDANNIGTINSSGISGTCTQNLSQ